MLTYSDIEGNFSMLLCTIRGIVALIFLPHSAHSRFCSNHFSLSFSATLAEDNLNLQQDLENMQFVLTKSSLHMHRLEHENQLMRSQLSCHIKSSDSGVTEDGVNQQMPPLNSSSLRLDSRSDSTKTKLPSEVKHLQFKESNLHAMLASSETNSLTPLLAKFVPFENSAVEVEHAATLIFEHFRSSADVVCHESASKTPLKESLLFSSSDNMASFPTICSSPSTISSNVLEMNANLQDKLRALQIKYDTDIKNALEDVNRYREIANHHESMFRRSFMSSLIEKFDSLGVLQSAKGFSADVLEANSQSHAVANAQRAFDLVVEASQREQTSKTEIESYREVLASYEDELNAAWCREAELSKELRSLSVALHKLRACQTSIFSTSPPPVSHRNLSFKTSLPDAKKLLETFLLETKIPPSDSFFDIEGIFTLQMHQILPLLTRQITSNHECQRGLTRLMQAIAQQDQELSAIDVAGPLPFTRMCSCALHTECIC